MKRKNRFADFLIGAVLIYIFVGICVVSLQALSGAKCGPIKLGGDYVYKVNQDAPRFVLLRALKWLPVAWDQIVDKDVPVGDFISPKECIWISDSGVPEDAENR
jgi:hypothetical protein